MMSPVCPDIFEMLLRGIYSVQSEADETLITDVRPQEALLYTLFFSFPDIPRQKVDPQHVRRPSGGGKPHVHQTTAGRAGKPDEVA